MTAGVRRRVDLELVRRGLVNSREDARRAVAELRVRAGGAVVEKASRLVAPGEPLVVDAATAPSYVSRGGDKLEAALDRFGIDPSERVCLDVGSSTGGFTDCLLQRGARRVLAVDVGRGQLHPRLREDPRVVVLERTNARRLTRAELPEAPSLATVDVSFISATKVTPAVRDVAVGGADVVVLVKPQFEAGRREVGRGGVVRDAGVRAAALEGVLEAVTAQGYAVLGTMESPLRGAEGNVEYLAHLRT